jgi:hypothetical protein
MVKALDTDVIEEDLTSWDRSIDGEASRASVSCYPQRMKLNGAVSVLICLLAAAGWAEVDDPEHTFPDALRQVEHAPLGLRRQMFLLLPISSQLELASHGLAVSRPPDLEWISILKEQNDPRVPEALRRLIENEESAAFFLGYLECAEQLWPYIETRESRSRITTAARTRISDMNDEKMQRRARRLLTDLKKKDPLYWIALILELAFFTGGGTGLMWCGYRKGLIESRVLRRGEMIEGPAAVKAGMLWIVLGLGGWLLAAGLIVLYHLDRLT